MKDLIILAGPCAIEGRDMALNIAEHLVKLSEKYSFTYVFKGSYRKANRTKADSFTGIGDEKALKILAEIGKTFQIKTVTDIHETHEAEMAAAHVDVLQIPAFLCRQTELLDAAAKTGKIVNVKKGQFLSGQSMGFAVEKIQKTNANAQVWLTERGNSFGYSDLVVDYRNIVHMKNFNVPVIMDCTHSLQKPNQTSGVTGGDPTMITTIAKAAVAVGADGLFIETHPEPQHAKSDGANMLRLDLFEDLVSQIIKIRSALA